MNNNRQGGLGAIPDADQFSVFLFRRKPPKLAAIFPAVVNPATSSEEYKYH